MAFDGPDGYIKSYILFNSDMFLVYRRQLEGASAMILGNAEYPYIAIAPRSTLALHGSTW